MGSLRLNYLFLIAIVAALFFQYPADAINLGTLQKASSAEVRAGETAIFHVLFWNSERTSYDIDILNIKSPNGWTVIVSPNQFQLNNTPSGKIERIYLPKTKNTLSAKVVDVYITPAQREAIGEYDIILQAKAGVSKEYGVSLLQERRFLFKVNVVLGSPKRVASPIDENKTVLIDIDPLVEGKNLDESELINIHGSEIDNKKEDSKLFFFGLALIIIIAWRIYRHD